MRTNRYESFADVPSAVRIAWLEAQAFPDRAEEILQHLMLDIYRLSTALAQRVTEAKADAARYREQAESEVRRARLHIEQALEGVVRVPLTDELDPHGFYVYLLWGTDRERPLYVGETTNLFARLGTHMSDRTKRRQVERITVLKCRSHTVMNSTEWSLIRLYQPPMNSIGIGSGGDRREPDAGAARAARQDRRQHALGAGSGPALSH